MYSAKITNTANKIEDCSLSDLHSWLMLTCPENYPDIDWDEFNESGKTSLKLEGKHTLTIIKHEENSEEAIKSQKEAQTKET